MAHSKPQNITARTYYDRLWIDVADLAADLANVAIDDMEHQFKKQRARDAYQELREILKQLGVF